MVLTPSPLSLPIFRERVVNIRQQESDAICVLANRTNMRISFGLAPHIAIGDEVAFSISSRDEIGGEVWIGHAGDNRAQP